ncbi:uncharacterized protein METZ01_LOCUS292507 [marine metagenome]|uniref:Uncharacterized protein n=1 Tax=marine metagenome TaxID=408172 RepID=A0A382LT76_9ZZZZ
MIFLSDLKGQPTIFFDLLSDSFIKTV